MNEDPKVNVSGLPREFVDAGASGNISAEVSSQVPVLQPEPELVVNPWDIVLCTSGTLISCENAIVVLIIFHNPSLRAPMFLLIGSLALADLLAGIGLIVNFVFAYLLQSEATKLVTIGLIVASFSASVCSLLAITVDRYLSLYYALTYHSERTVTFTYVMLFMLWGTSICLGLLPVLGWNCLHNLPDCSTILPLYSKKYIAFCISIFMAILVTIVILYARIYFLVKSSSRRVASPHNSERSMALLRTVVIVVSVFIACWSPLFILFLVDVACKVKECAILFKAQWFIVLAVLNSAMNPVIYTLASKEMRRAFFRLVCTCLVRGRGAHSSPIQHLNCLFILKISSSE